jgi:hypothetical protein
MKRIDQFIQLISEPQGFFRYSPQGVIFLNGRLAGKLIKDLHNQNGEGLEEYLEELYYHEDTNYHTKEVIKDIFKYEISVRKHFK